MQGLGQPERAFPRYFGTRNTEKCRKPRFNAGARLILDQPDVVGARLLDC
jgi:hypothetical protein